MRRATLVNKLNKKDEFYLMNSLVKAKKYEIRDILESDKSYEDKFKFLEELVFTILKAYCNSFFTDVLMTINKAKISELTSQVEDMVNPISKVRRYTIILKNGFNDHDFLITDCGDEKRRVTEIVHFVNLWFKVSYINKVIRGRNE